MADRGPSQAPTCLSLIAERGIDLKAIAEITGHGSIRTTAVYVEANPRRLARHPAARDVVSAADPRPSSTGRRSGSRPTGGPASPSDWSETGRPPAPSRGIWPSAARDGEKRITEETVGTYYVSRRAKGAHTRSSSSTT
jgi:hypothetical protein